MPVEKEVERKNVSPFRFFAGVYFRERVPEKRRFHGLKVMIEWDPEDDFRSFSPCLDLSHQD
jgi:hypothetical protein